MPGRVPPIEEVMGYVQKLKNWGRWGADDQLGCVNYITPEKRKRATAVVKEGVTVTCARQIKAENAPDLVQGPPLRFMSGSGETWAGKKQGVGVQGSSDFFGIFYHGYTVTHLDSLAHVFWDGKMYGGFASETVSTSREGALRESIDVLHNGIVTRGVLMDAPRSLGVKWMESGQGVFPEDLERMEKAQGVKVESGDIVFLRTGELRRRNEQGPLELSKRGYPGFHAACLPWLHERQVAIIGADSATDVQPSGYKELQSPCHQIGIPSMGLWLLDNANLEDLAAACERYKRWEFMLVLAPLRVAGGTGCPINPIATF